MHFFWFFLFFFISLWIYWKFRDLRRLWNVLTNIMWEKLQILWGNVGFIEKRAAKWRNGRQFILWRMIFRNRFRIEFGMTVWQYSEWQYNNILDDIMTTFGMTDFFWFWNITYYASGWDDGVIIFGFLRTSCTKKNMISI